MSTWAPENRPADLWALSCSLRDAWDHDHGHFTGPDLDINPTLPLLGTCWDVTSYGARFLFAGLGASNRSEALVKGAQLGMLDG